MQSDIAKTWRSLKSILRQYGKSATALGLLPIATSWVADDLRRLLSGGDPMTPTDLTGFGIALALTLVAPYVFVSSLRRVAFEVQRFTMADGVKPHAVWVGSVSTTGWSWTPERLTLTGKSPKELPLPPDLDGAIAAMGTASSPQFAWEQILRGLRPHAARLRRVVLLVSPSGGKTSASEPQYEECAAMIRHYFRPETIEKRIVPFEDLEGLLGVLREVVATEKDPAEIMFDVTGGMKMVSIAAAIVSLEHPKVEFQYVETQGEKRVRAFNVVTSVDPA